MLRAQLGHMATIFKVIFLAIVGVMAVLTCTLIGLQSYNNWTQTEAGSDGYARPLLQETARFRVAYFTLYMLSVLASGALALMTIMSLRKSRSPAGVSLDVSLLQDITNDSTGSHWMGCCPDHRHGLLGHHPSRLGGFKPSGEFMGVGNICRSNLPYRPWPSTQLHLHPLHCETRSLEHTRSRRSDHGCRCVCRRPGAQAIRAQRQPEPGLLLPTSTSVQWRGESNDASHQIGRPSVSVLERKGHQSNGMNSC